ncbi:hypothetical protein ACFVQ9_15625 [Streptomyces goshikiensis]|uniref:hypothetical protein n=1 Tax=Streptomyces goshikiensis TaxID=1942 RepID=UPI0036C0B102
MDEATDPRMGLAPRNCLAYTGVHQRRYSQSRTLFTEAFNLRRRALDPAEEARALIGLASVHVSVGKGDQAISRVTTGLNVSRPPHNAWVTSIAFVIQDLAHQLERRNEEALACFAEARTHADRSRGPRLLGRVLSFAAGIYLLPRPVRRRQEPAPPGSPSGRGGGLGRLPQRARPHPAGTAEQGEEDLVAAMALHHQAALQNQLLSPLT